MMPDAFKDQVAVVTGASQGIGRSIALELATHRASLCLVGRDPDKLEHVAARARTSAAHVMCQRADLTRDDDVRALTASVEREFGHADVLVLCAGSYARGPIDEVPGEALDALYRDNVHAPYVLVRALLPLLRRRRGQVVFVNSTLGLRAPGGVSQYALTQHALKALADSLRDEVNPLGIRVLTIHPGRTATPRQAAIHAMEAKPYHPERLMQPEDVAAMVSAALALPRTAEVTDITIRPMQKPA
jgi:NAD(P)-dependent dehydrogenase (short-subunit alcohol dehydrogenase family)